MPWPAVVPHPNVPNYSRFVDAWMRGTGSTKVLNRTAGVYQPKSRTGVRVRVLSEPTAPLLRPLLTKRCDEGVLPLGWPTCAAFHSAFVSADTVTTEY